MSTRTAIYALVAAVSLVTAGLQAADASSDVPEAAAIGLGQEHAVADAGSTTTVRSDTPSAAQR